MKYLHSILASIATGLLMASCSESDNFSPGPQSQATDAGVYFLGNYDAQTVIGEEPTIEDTLWFELGRKDTLTAIDVPIVVDSKDECINVPQYVHFEAGDSTAWLGLTYVGLEYGKDSRFVLRIGDQYANPYAEKDGSTRLQASILRSQWVDVCDTLIFGPNSKPWPDQGCDLQRLEGQKRLRFTNFLGSGQPLEFSLRSGWNDNDVTLSKGEINPLSNYYDSGTYWYFTNGGNYAEWTPVGSEKTISWMYFWVGSNYTFIDLQCDRATSPTLTWGGKQYYCDYTNHYSLMTAWILYSDGTSGWEYIYLYPGYL